ncbi:MAG: hypothetical protein JXB13_03555 [Phycisphaerae bacterium]|nr:hypothetical protein [Phycisphaerae bacterium]
MVEAIPPPTAQQIQDFASFVSEAKSWYKHLPLLPPGEPFWFFIDPWAGLDRILGRRGQVVYVNRTSETLQFHYTWMTTEDYRSRFGRLAFACAAGTELFLPVSVRLTDNREIRGVLANNPSRASVHTTEETEYRLPPEVLNAGTTRVTGVIHKLTGTPWVWLGFLPDNADSVGWPEETGGSETIGRIIARCHTIQREATQSGAAEGNQKLDAIDEELTTLLAPERRRLQREMVLSMNRIVTLLYGGSV